LKVKYKIVEDDEKKTELLNENKEHDFPNLDDDSSDSSKSSKEDSEEEEDEEDSLPVWDKKSIAPANKIFIDKKKKAIVENINTGFGIIKTKKPLEKFSVKNLTFIQYSGFYLF
jgi:hypothetical protein